MNKLREIFSRRPEKMSRIVKWIFALPLSYTFFLCFSLLIPSFGQSNNAFLLRSALLEAILGLCVIAVCKYFLLFDIQRFFSRNKPFSVQILLKTLLITVICFVFTTLIQILACPSCFDFTFDKTCFVSSWICAIVLIIVAALVEELIFRGFLSFFMMEEHIKGKKLFIYCLISGVLFLVFHFDNPEINSSYAIWSMIFYFIFGFSLMLFYLKRGSLDIPVGIHIGNNLVLALFFSYDNSVINTNALFTNHNSIGLVLIIQTVFCIILLLLFLRSDLSDS